MQTNPFIASQLYTNAQNVSKPAEHGSSGSNLFADMANDFMATMKAGENAAIAGMTGKADAASVVQALAASEIAIQTAVSVRDRVVEAYQEILRMPV
ncbi:MAG: flagellar hook-basal body complex protein FliE [Rhodobacteraceae bacterium]|nr:flagellar hook-basal body complex protein FliE [Paracoccaceae bacterium]